MFDTVLLNTSTSRSSKAHLSHFNSPNYFAFLPHTIYSNTDHCLNLMTHFGFCICKVSQLFTSFSSLFFDTLLLRQSNPNHKILDKICPGSIGDYTRSPDQSQLLKHQFVPYEERMSSSSSTQPPPRVYFAYGSNLYEIQMRQRCPTSTLFLPNPLAHLEAYSWTISIRGYANVLPNPSSVVHGLLYTLQPADEAELDMYEGVSSGAYEKMEMEVVCGGEAVMALVYVDPRSQMGVCREEYWARLKRGFTDAQRWGMNKEWIVDVEREFKPVGL